MSSVPVAACDKKGQTKHRLGQKSHKREQEQCAGAMKKQQPHQEVEQNRVPVLLLVRHDERMTAASLNKEDEGRKDKG